MAKIDSLSDITTGYGATTVYNANNDRIEEAFQNTLSRDGSGPNDMEANLDMNGFRILNHPAPVSPNDLARIRDIEALVAVAEGTTTDVPGLVIPQTFEAPEGGSTDAHAELQAMADYAKMTGGTFYIPPGEGYYSAGTLDLIGCRYIDIKGQVTFADGHHMLVGGFSQSGDPVHWYFGDIRHHAAKAEALFTNMPSSYVLRISGVKQGVIRLGNIQWLDFHADSDLAANGQGSSGYFVILGGYVPKVTFTRVNSGWVNEFTWVRPRLEKWIHDETNNGLPFGGAVTVYEPNFEGSRVEIDINNFRDCRFYRCRFEAADSSTITLGTNTNNIHFTQLWRGQLPSHLFRPPSINFVNNGGPDNLLYRDGQDLWLPFNLCQLSPSTLLLADAVGVVASSQPGVLSSSLRPGPERVEQASSGTQVLYRSGLIPVDTAFYVRFDLEADSALFRPRVYCYDSNKRLLTTEPTSVIGNGAPTWSSSGYWQYGAALSTNSLTFACSPNRDVAFIRVDILSSATGTFSRAQADLLIAPHYPRDPLILNSANRPPNRALSATPIGVAPIGTIISKTAGTGHYASTAYVSTALANNATTGASSVVLDDATGVSVGDQILIALNDRSTHRTTVSSVSTNTVGLSSNLPSAASAGRLVETGKWADVTY